MRHFRQSGAILISGWPLWMLTRQLATPLGRVVVDDTGLSGNWDLELQYAPEAGGRQMPVQPGPMSPWSPHYRISSDSNWNQRELAST